jgi:hypothetical protein
MVLHQFTHKASAKKILQSEKIGPPLSPGTREYTESVLRRKKLIPCKPYVCGKHVESILGTRKNLTKKVFNLNNTIPHSVRLVNPLHLQPLECDKMQKYLDISKFSMGNILTFLDKYYKYGVDPDPNRCGLTIGGFESAFKADLKVFYIFDKLMNHPERHI